MTDSLPSWLCVAKTSLSYKSNYKGFFRFFCLVIMQIKTTIFITLAVCDMTHASLPSGCIKDLRWVPMTNDTISFPINLMPAGWTPWSGSSPGTCKDDHGVPGSSCGYVCRCAFEGGMYAGATFLDMLNPSTGQGGAVCATKWNNDIHPVQPGENQPSCTSFEVLTFDKYDC
jgi:hypothetical protein